MNEIKRRLPRPTTALPGTPEKVEVMRKRNENGEFLYHPRDAKWDGQTAIDKTQLGSTGRRAAGAPDGGLFRAGAA